MSKAAHFKKKQKPESSTPFVKTEKFTKQEQHKADLDYLNQKRTNPTRQYPIISGAVDPFTCDDVDETVLREDALDRREHAVPPVAGRMWRDED